MSPCKSKQLLAEAGYGQGFTVHMDSSSGMFCREKEVTEALLNQWAKVGVKLEVDYGWNSPSRDSV
jgi:peptide/nickel transport system substrate-binding protein